MSEFIVDDIIDELSADERLKLAECQLKVVAIESLPSFEDKILDDPKYQQAKFKLLDGQDSAFKLDLKVIGTKEFKKSINGLTPQTLTEGMWKNVKHDDPDTLVVRHLRARDFKVDVALCMMLNSVRWRTEFKVVDELLAGGDERLNNLSESGEGQDKKVASEVMAQIRSGKSFTHGTDRQGRPLLFVRVIKHNPGMQGLDGFEKYAVFQSETARMAMRPPNTTAAIIFDLGGFSMANMDWNAVRLLTLGLEDKYPESMGATYVYRAPWIISGIWSVVKKMMPGKEAQKVMFVKDAKALSEFVDLKYLPPEMGGTQDFEYQYIEPVAGENEKQKATAARDEVMKQQQLIIDEYEKAGREWAELLLLEHAQATPGSGVNAAVMAGAREKTTAKTVEQAEKDKRDTVTKMRVNYWKLDPYVRGRTLLERSGMLGPDGELRTDHFVNGENTT